VALQPWLGDFAKSLNAAAQLQNVTVPNFFGRSPTNAGGTGDARTDVRVVLNDLFGRRDGDGGRAPPTADVVATSFLIDAIEPRRGGEMGLGFVAVLAAVDALVAPGGLWVNLGPLQFHFFAMAPKLSVDDIVAWFVLERGYAVVRPPRLLAQLPYSRGRGSRLGGLEHAPAFFVLRKPAA
jgi:hypothetical protein